MPTPVKSLRQRAQELIDSLPSTSPIQVAVYIQNPGLLEFLTAYAASRGTDRNRIINLALEFWAQFVTQEGVLREEGAGGGVWSAPGVSTQTAGLPKKRRKAKSAKSTKKANGKGARGVSFTEMGD